MGNVVKDGESNGDSDSELTAEYTELTAEANPAYA